MDSAEPQTHHVAFAAPIADYLVTMDEDGTVKSAGPMEQADALVPLDSPEVEETKVLGLQVKELSGTETPKPKPEEKNKHKLIQAEEKSEGRISRQAMFSFFS